MQILIPMAGEGTRFQAAGFDTPKPFIKFCGKTMIENVIENLGLNNQFILVPQLDHFGQYNQTFNAIEQNINRFNLSFRPIQKGTVKFQLLGSITQGAAETCLKAEQLLDRDKPVMIANSDQMMEWNQNHFKSWFLDSGLDGAIITFQSQDPKNSYAEIDKEGLVVRTAEKEVISRYATNGIYVWRKAKDFIEAAKEMIFHNQRVNNEFYVCPCFNRNISWKQKIGVYHIDKHWPIGTPPDLVAYLDHLVGQ